jgi:hypothetical protein
LKSAEKKPPMEATRVIKVKPSLTLSFLNTSYLKNMPNTWVSQWLTW